MVEHVGAGSDCAGLASLLAGSESTATVRPAMRTVCGVGTSANETTVSVLVAAGADVGSVDGTACAAAARESAN